MQRPRLLLLREQKSASYKCKPSITSLITLNDLSHFLVSPETLPSEVLSKMGAAPRTSDPFVSKEQLPEFDGFIFVIPTRYGRAVAQFSAFFDQTGGLWATQALNKKFATVITSTATQHGGQETTALTTIPFFAHQ